MPPHLPTMPALSDDMVQEILLRVPPDEPASLVRASLVRSNWRNLLVQPHFATRYSIRHGTPPLLGFFLSNQRGVSFVPATSFRPAATTFDLKCRLTLHCRHGRVLLCETVFNKPELIIWDPITSEHLRLPRMPVTPTGWLHATLLCGAVCQRRGCYDNPFRVAIMWTDYTSASACIYSSATGAWGDVTEQEFENNNRVSVIAQFPAALVGDALYYTSNGAVILQYDTTGSEISSLRVPQEYDNWTLMALEDGSLGFGGFDEVRFELRIWRYAEANGQWAWTKTIDIDLHLPMGHHIDQASMRAFSDDANVVFVNTVAGLFSVDVNSSKTKKVIHRDGVPAMGAIHPYFAFYTPRQ
ncbi:hypothetical protein QOZ80_3BG0283750 [Eleusine coracana subsp. coracana]|nr:hypothetical protein QOZ80_3BG0283750 [Eleusine coracana subsp. coracana]